MMTNVPGVPTPSADALVSLHRSQVNQAFQLWAPIAGVSPAQLPELDETGALRVGLLRGDPSSSHGHLAHPLAVLAFRGELAKQAFRIYLPSDPPPLPGQFYSAECLWDRFNVAPGQRAGLAARVAEAGSLLLKIELDPVNPDLSAQRLWPRIQFFADCVGLVASLPERFPSYLIATLTPGPDGIAFLPTTASAARLFEKALALHGGTGLTVSIRDPGSVLGPQPWSEVLATRGEYAWIPRGPASEKHLQLWAVITAAVAPDLVRGALPTRDLAELARALHDAHRSAPRGYVGLKIFREKLWLSGESHQKKKELLEVAIAEGMVRVDSVKDEISGKPLAALSLVPEHALVREALATAAGELPPLLDLRGPPLSETLLRSRDEER